MFRECRFDGSDDDDDTGQKRLGQVLLHGKRGTPAGSASVPLGKYTYGSELTFDPARGGNHLELHYEQTQSIDVNQLSHGFTSMLCVCSKCNSR